MPNRRAIYVISDSTGETGAKVVQAALLALCLISACSSPPEREPGALADTYGRALANVQAGYEFGVRDFDSALGGLGGCPYAPGAAGNVATEDLVYLFHRMGLDTGIDIGRYLEACEIALSFPDGATGGHARIIPLKRLMASLDDRFRGRGLAAE